MEAPVIFSPTVCALFLEWNRVQFRQIVFKISIEPTYLPPLVHGVIERPLAQFLTLIKCDELALALLSPLRQNLEKKTNS